MEKSYCSVTVDYVYYNLVRYYLTYEQSNNEFVGYLLKVQAAD